MLLEHGASRTLANADGKTALRYAQDQNKGEIAQILTHSPEEVSFSYPLDNRVMQEIYNFPRRERVTLIRKTEGGDVEAMQRDSFAALDDETGLAKAFNEHRRRGGKLLEEDVFRHRVTKISLRPKER